MFVKFLKQYRSNKFLKHEQAVGDFEILFNPSFQVGNGRKYFAIRGKRKFADGDIRAYIVLDGKDGACKVEDLTEYCSGFGISRVADPKLLLLDGEVWCTFNTGFVASGRNEIYLLKLEPNLSKPQLVSYDGRSRIEKNWAFFKHGGELLALYGLGNVRILKCEDPGADRLIFRSHKEFGHIGLKKYTIGTQFADAGDRLYFVAHRKIQFLKKRLYLGKVFSINKSDGLVVPMSSFLAHSFGALFGSRKKFNKNLLSCTYFSGICLDRDGLILGYGINDIDYSVCEVKLDLIWK